AGAHGEAFTYRTVNTDVLGWIVSRVGGKPFTEQLSERIWAPMGAEADGYFQVDPVGTPFAGGGFNARLRDLARFGELMRRGGRMGGKQIVPAAAIEDIVRGARKEDFAKAGYATLPGWSYRNQWWVSHNAHGAYTARGIHGQAIYVDPKAEMVIARFASHPMAANANFDPTSLPAYQALAEHLMRAK
ncbi:MAG: serine hydrolase, partial [Sphingomonadaceae bacterium]|nr:serine hydrolase [Sphingomonadaceae bacterium]